MLKAGIVSLGCARNQVDSEIMLGSLKKAGMEPAGIGDDLDICIVNTCAFIDSAREESVDSILEVAALKRSGRIKHIVVCGCLSQLYKEKLAAEVPEIDLILGTADFPKIADLVKGIKGGHSRTIVSKKPSYLYDEDSPRALLTPRHYAYVKISEGCSNFCSYCIISRLRGAFRSRSIESVVAEVRRISKGGALKEIDLIGQDTTLFGIDRYGKPAFPALLKRLCGLKNSIRWIRILYTHPDHYTGELISTIRGEEKICKYLDLPVQHISDKILKKMNRRVTKSGILGLIENLRKNIPGLTLRTSVIVGFPGETDKDFRELLGFLAQTRFERLGAFPYSREDGTRAAGFRDQVPRKVKEERLDEVMKLQQKISRSVNASLLGKTVDVLIDEKVPGESARFIGRRAADAPEVDGTVYVTHEPERSSVQGSAPPNRRSFTGRSAKVGDFCRVKITGTLEYDLIGSSA